MKSSFAETNSAAPVGAASDDPHVRTDLTCVARASRSESPPSWYETTAFLASLGSILMWASLPPLGWSALAWAVPIPWSVLVLQPKLNGRRPRTAIYLAGFAFWMGALHWLRLPHWATSIGWVALSAYLAVYPLLFVLLSRVGVHRFGLSVLIVAPLVWAGLEVIRGHALSGFTISSLAHTQYRWHGWIQAADLLGCYGLSGLLVLAAASVACFFSPRKRRWMWSVASLIVAVVLPLMYGSWRTRGNHTRPGATVAVIQGSIDTTFMDEEGKDARVMRQYAEQTQAAVESRAVERAKNPRLSGIDLIVWPESMFRYPLVSFSDDYEFPPEMRQSVAGKLPKQIEIESHNAPGQFFSKLGLPVLIGVGREHLAPERQQRFNSAAFVSAAGKLLSVYDKTHLVMFGEYVPLFNWWPSLYRLTPMGEGLTAGERAVAEEIDGVWFSPTICYETVVPHLYRRQIHELRGAGTEPDVLVNLTNDGWFWGSSALDLHLICGVFRAIECRKPLLIAANTGFSAWIDAGGRIIKQGPRRDTGFILADVELDDRTSLYLSYGAWIELFYAAPCLILGLGGLWRSQARRQTFDSRDCP